MKFILFLSLITVSLSLKFRSPTNEITQRNIDLFKYSPDDEYTLPEDIDDDKPPTNFVGNVKQAKTLVLENKNHGKGKFKYSIETQNGIELTQIGKLRDANTFVISGSYSYTGADGRRYKVRYTADEFGYHPITELDIEIPDIQSGDQIVQPFKLIDLNNINNNDRYGDSRHTEGDSGHSDDDHDGYHYDNPAEKAYHYPKPSPDLSAPKIFI